MQQINAFKLFITAFVCLTIVSEASAQSNGDRRNLVNKNWRIMAMKCPDAYNNANDPDQYVHYYGNIMFTAANSQSVNYGTYVKLTRDASDNPVEKGTYSIVTDDANVTRLVLKPNKSTEETTYVIESCFPNYLTLLNQGENAKCKVSYAIAP